jgi:hypothetical protein
VVASPKPILEKVQRLLARFSARSQQLIYLGIFCGLCYINPDPYPLLVIAAIAITMLVNRNRILMVALFNVLSSAIWYDPYQHRPPWLPVVHPATFAVTNLAVLAFFYILLVSTRKMPRIIALAIPIGGAVTGIYFFPLLLPVGRLALGFFCNHLWFNAFLIRNQGERFSLTIPEFLASQRPFFSRALFPVPPLLHLHLKSNDSDCIVRAQRSGVALYAVLTVVDFALVGLKRLSATHPVLGATMDIVLPKTFTLMESNFTTFDKWAIIYGSYAYWIGGIVFVLFGCDVVASRMLGSPTPGSVGNIFSSTSLYDFWARSNVYYSKLVLDIFVSPIHRALRRIPSPPWRLWLSLFLGILIGGFAFHLTIGMFWGIATGRLISKTISALPFWTAIGLAMIPYVFFRRKPHRDSSFTNQAVQFAIYFSISMLIAILDRDLYSYTGPQIPKIAFLLSLLGVR